MPACKQTHTRCVYYNPEKEVFSSDGCTTLNSFNNSMVRCAYSMYLRAQVRVRVQVGV